MIRVGLVGAPSAGKSTTAAWVYAELKEAGIKTELVQEYAREYINTNGPLTDTLAQFMLYEGQMKRETILPDSIEVMVTDSPIILSYIYAAHYADLNNRTHKELLISLYRKMLDAAKRYDLLYFLEANRPYVLDGTRNQTKEEARLIGDKIRNFLEMHNIPHQKLTDASTKVRSAQIVSDILIRRSLS